MIDTSQVTRFEIIDHSACQECGGSGRASTPTDIFDDKSITFYKECENCFGSGVPGREVIVFDGNKQLDFELQDDGRTLKLFIHESIVDSID